MSGSLARQRATTTFCWLPPLSVEISEPGVSVLISRRRLHSSTRARLVAMRELAAPAEPAEDRQREVLADRELVDHALALAVGRDERDVRRP